MKKSQAEKIIVNTIEANQNDNVNEIASYILYELLEAGILPPESKFKICAGTYSDTGNEFYEYKYFNKWEDEDV